MSEQTATAPRGGSLEVKTVPDTVGAAFEEFMEAFEAFKDVNDRRLGEIEGKLTADVVTREKVDRINKAMDDNKKPLISPEAIQQVEEARKKIIAGEIKVTDAMNK